MDDNCHVEPIYKDTVSAETLRNADNALLAVWGMGCENCVTRVRNSLLSVEGVFGVDVYLNMAMAEVRYDGKMISPETLVNAVARAGNDGRHEYRAQLVSGEVVNP